MEQTKVSVRNVFSEEEMVELGKELGQVEIEKSETENDKKSAMKTYNNKIDGFNVRIKTLSNQLNEGFEIVDVLCNIELDFTRKIRRYINVNTAVIEKEEALHREDYQLEILSQEPITDINDSELY